MLWGVVEAEVPGLLEGLLSSQSPLMTCFGVQTLFTVMVFESETRNLCCRPLPLPLTPGLLAKSWPFLEAWVTWMSTYHACKRWKRVI